MKTTRSLLVALAVALAWATACQRAPNVQDQVKGFIAQLQDPKPESNQKAAAELMKIGQPAAGPVAELLLSEDPQLRSRAASVIWGMGAKGAVAAPNLATLLSDPQADVRVAAAMALENMGREARVAVPELTKALDDSEGQVRMWAIRALGKIGPEAKSAVPALHRLSKKQASMEILVREALQEIQALRVFVTGATGYLGSALVRALVAAGHQPVGLTRSRTKTVTPGGSKVEWVFGNIRDPYSYEKAAAGCDAFVHLAAEYGPEVATLDLLAVQTLLAAALVHDGPRTLVYTSGLWVLGATGDRPADESWTTDRPAQAVAWRPAHERHVLDARGESLVTVVVRPGMVFGRKGGLFDKFFADSRSEGAAVVVGDGKNRWSTVHVDDVAALYVAVLVKAHTLVRALPPRERVFHAMSGWAERVDDIARAANQVAGGAGTVRHWPVEEARATYGPMADALALDQVVRATRTERVLGFRPMAPGFVPYAPEAFREYTSA